MLYVIICVVFAILTALVGRAKGSYTIVWFFIGGLVPIIGLITALCMPSEREELRRQCPRCGRVHKLTDQICACGEELYFPDEAIESPAAAERRTQVA